MKATWIKDYDIATDSCFSRPGCPECYAPVGLEDERYLCYSCGEEYEIDADMKAWFELREGEKIEMEDCNLGFNMHGCGGKKCMAVHYTKNPVTLEWEIRGGKCEKCGVRFIV